MKILLPLLCAISLLSGCSHAPSDAKSSQPSATPKQPDFHVDPATAGSISGTVHWNGPRPARVPIDMSGDPACVGANKGKVYEDSVVLGKQNTVANAFLYIKSGLEGKTFAVPSTAVTIDQRGCWFHPRVFGVQAGQEVDIVNSDPVTHSIHPMAHVNREWNHSQGPGDPPMHRRFLKPEIMIPVKCNIHSWMHAYIGVLDHPYFAVSSPDGTFSIPNLPPGTYTVALWHEKLGTQEQQITVPTHGHASLDFELKPK
jgi:plastocyanin